MKFTKELGINTGLAFAAGFITTFGVFMTATPKAPGTSALLAASGAAVWAGFRAAVGFAALNAKSVSALPVDE